jgi:hypothetical protein
MLCARVILFFDLVFYIPLSKVDENMKRAHARDAVLKQKFFFRKHLVPLAVRWPGGCGGGRRGADGANDVCVRGCSGPVRPGGRDEGGRGGLCGFGRAASDAATNVRAMAGHV